MTYMGMPGVDALRSSVSRDLIWGGDVNQVGVLYGHGVQYSSTILDAGNTPTTHIRPGLLVGRETSSGELSEWDADASDGSQNLWGVVPGEFSTLDIDGTAADKLAPSPIVRAPLRAASLLIQGTALTSHVDEFLARRALHAMGCVLDDDPQGWLAGQGGRIEQRTTAVLANNTLVEADNGKTIFFNNAASVTVTLPTIHPGLEYTLIRNGDEEFIVASAEGDNIIGINDLSVDSITFTTATEHLGVAVHVRSLYMGTTLKWLLDILYTAHDAGGTTPATYTVST